MKKLLFAAVAMLFAACTTDVTEDVAVNIPTSPDAITVSFDEDSRVQLAEGKTVWTAGDQVSVFYRSDANHCYEFTGETGDRTGALLKISEESAITTTSDIIVVYPYNTNYSISTENKTIDVTIPSIQHYEHGSYGVGDNIMISSGISDIFYLKNVCGWISISLTGVEKITKITLKGNSNEQLAGKAVVNYSDYSLTSLSNIVEEGENEEVGGILTTTDEYVREITLDLGDGVQLTDKPTRFYFTVIPQEFSKGITVCATSADGSEMTKSTDNDIVVNRNEIKPMEPIEYDGISDDELTIYDIDYTHFATRFKYPTDKIQPNNVIKWKLIELPEYYSLYEGLSDADMMNQHDGAYRNYISKTTVWTFNNDNRFIGDEVDDLTMYNPIMAGQPMYLMFGEFAWDTNNHWGWGDGYYAPLFDDQNYWVDFATTGKQPDQKNYWSGYYRRELVKSKSPSLMSEKPDITMNLIPRGGTITITPNDSIYSFCYAVLNPAQYLNIIPLLNNNPDYMQWYITSYHAYMAGVSQTAFDTTTIDLNSLFPDGLSQNTQYTLYITSLGDELGSKQSYITQTFTLPKPTKPAPTFVITDNRNNVADARWDQAYFNIKCTSGDAYQAKYISNYEREYQEFLNMYLKGGFSEAEANDIIVDSYGVSFTAEEITLINSAEGLNISFDSRADATTFLGVRLMNDEGLVTTSVASARSESEPDATPINSTLFEDLKGEWTASATIRFTHYHYRENPAEGQDHNYQVTIDENLNCSVTIGDVGYEETLPESVYQLFYNSSSLQTKEEVDAVYNQFKTTVDDFNAHTRGQNRILCQGFDLEYDYDLLPCPSPDHTADIDHTTAAKYASPYDLFIADSNTYSAYNYESPIFDFGPKWFLEVAADGSLSVPFNTTYFYPMSQWKDHIYQLIGLSDSASLPYVRDSSGNIINGHFPATVSDDKNTITIYPMQYTYSSTGTTITEDFYPNIVRQYSNGYLAYSRIVSPIILTRNGTNTAELSSVKPTILNNTRVTNDAISLEPLCFATTPKSRTALPTTQVVPTTERIKHNPLSAEQLNKTRYGRK